MARSPGAVAAARLTDTNYQVLLDWLSAAVTYRCGATPAAADATRLGASVLDVLLTTGKDHWNVAVAVLGDGNHLALNFDCIPLDRQDPAEAARELYQLPFDLFVQHSEGQLRVHIRLDHAQPPPRHIGGHEHPGAAAPHRPSS